MTDTVTASPESSRPPDKPPMSTGDKVRFVLRGVGQTLITLGLVVLLFVVYEVWITNLFADAANHRLATKIEHEWANGDDPLLKLPGGGHSTVKLGSGIANLYIPRLGRDYHFTVIEGVTQDDLAQGPGHYPGTALPGAVGNFAVAGHRVGKGEPFLNIDQLRSDDAVIVETKSYWYVYRVLGRQGANPQDTGAEVRAGNAQVHLPGREIVDPTDGNVLEPVPDHPGVAAQDKLMTMTTCHPKFTAAQRMIVYSMLEQTVKVPYVNGKRMAAMPATVSALYNEVTS